MDAYPWQGFKIPAFYNLSIQVDRFITVLIYRIY
jgi:hypothetical protein